MIQPRIYIDYHATTPVDPQVFKALGSYFTEIYGNPASKNHGYESEAKAAFDIARGDSLFQGISRFASGGTACIGCHHTAALDWLGGGTLGPDLTQVYGWLGGRRKALPK